MNKSTIAISMGALILFLSACGSEAELEAETPVTEKSVVAETTETEDIYVYYLHTDSDCQSIWERMAGIFSRRTGIPVTVEYVDADEYDIRLQQVMAEQEMPTAFLLPDTRTAYVWDDYTVELSGTELGEKVRYPSEYFYYCGKAAGVPERAAPDRTYIALNGIADQGSVDATEKFFTWIFCSAEGRMAFPNRGLSDCYE